MEINIIKKIDLLLSSPKYQKSIVALIGAILIIVLLIPFVIVPQLQVVLKARDDITQAKVLLKKLQDKKTSLQTMDDAKLRHDLSLATLAIPTSKDIGAALVTLDILAQKNLVTLGNYSSTVGSIEGGSDLKVNPNAPQLSAPSIRITIAVVGEKENIKAFLSAVTTALPLMEVDEISAAKNITTIGISSYYKPILASAPALDSQLPSADKFNPVLTLLASRSAQIGLSVDTTPPIDFSQPSQDLQLFKRANPFF